MTQEFTGEKLLSDLPETDGELITLVPVQETEVKYVQIAEDIGDEQTVA
jgi:hypothetical protein